MTAEVQKKRRSTGRATLSDVAKLAGVGTMTVSRALRMPEMVSDKLREKIQNAVDELGYLPNLAASNLASASSNTIAMIVPSFCEPGCTEVFAGLQQILQPAGYHILISESQYFPEREKTLVETFLPYNLAAVILLGIEHTQQTVRLLKNANIPVIEIGAMRQNPIDMNIGIDVIATMNHLVENVISRGYENLGLLCATQESWLFQQHLGGWHKALLRRHISPHRVINAAEPPSFSVGARLLPEFILNWPEIDALICTSDELACGALYECQRRHIYVPTQLAVAGFGGSDISEVCQPPLTTINVPYQEIGVKAGQTLIQRLQDESVKIIDLPSVNSLLKIRSSI